MAESEELAGRSYARVYRVSGKRDIHVFVREAVERSGGRVLFESSATRAPVYLGVEGSGDERLGVLAYLFRATRVVTSNRPTDENKLQVRYGSEETWHVEDHPVGRDIAGVDVSVVLGVHVESGVLLGLDPLRYDPLPMGISIEFKDEHVDAARSNGWHVWERENRPGTVRDARTPEGLETLVAFAPERLLDYVRLERQATALGLDPPLRYRAAMAAGEQAPAGVAARHVLEQDFALSSAEILDIIGARSRLAMAVRGGVAEHHLGRRLAEDPQVRHVEAVDLDGGDFAVELASGHELLVECKNASPTPYADGSLRVEVQKTRASKGDPASRYYRRDQFGVLAACLFSPTRVWDFRFLRAAALRRHGDFPDRIAPMQRIDASWSESLAAAL